MITMLVVAGPPGSGKSSVLRPAGKMAYFNADERARELNKGQGHGISREIRSVVNRQLEEFINGHIQAATSFSYETTLRTPITFEQARVAKLHGFETQMDYVALGSADESIARVRARSVQGGHSAPPERIREIYESSMKNLSRAINEFDTVRVYDNSDRVGREAPTLVLESVEGRVVGLVAAVPDWTVRALQGTAYDISRLLRRKNDITSLGPGY